MSASDVRLTQENPKPPIPNNDDSKLTLNPTGFHALRPLHLRLGHAPEPPPSNRAAPHSLAVQQRRAAQNHRPRSLSVPHARPDAARPRGLEPDLHRRDPHRPPSAVQHLNHQQRLLAQRPQQQQRRGILPTAHPRREREQERHRQGYSDGGGRVPGCHGFLLVYAAGGRVDVRFQRRAGGQRGAVLFRRVDAAVCAGADADEQEYGCG